MINWLQSISGVHIASPWFLLVLPIVLLVLLVGLTRKRPSLTVSTLQTYKAAVRRVSKLMNPLRLPLYFEVVAAVLIIVALMRPQFGVEETITRTQGIDIMLAIDVSGSMETHDVPKSLVKNPEGMTRQDQRRIGAYLNSDQARPRIEVAKEEVRTFIERRPHDRIGLVAFGSHAYTVCPPTLDHDFLTGHLARLHAGMLHDRQTGIAEPVGNSTARLKESNAKRRVMVLFTDGANNVEAQVTPEQAASIAAMFDITMYTVGVGSELAYARGAFNRWQSQPASFDAALLERMAKSTGGRYFRAEDGSGLQDVMKQIDALETVEFEQPKFIDYNDLYDRWLYGGLIVILLALAFENTISLKVP
jgi:Ca-activated chloride channel family protein